MGVATGCGCKVVYRFPHTTYPYICVCTRACVCVCVYVCVCDCIFVCVCVCVFYHISSDIAHVAATTMIRISFARYALHYYNRDFSRKSFVLLLRRHLFTVTSTVAIAATFSLILR